MSLLKIKSVVNANVQRYQAILIVRGFSQIQSIDLKATFSPVFRCTSIKMILTTVVQENVKLKQFDFKTGFRNGDIEEYVCMKKVFLMAPIRFANY